MSPKVNRREFVKTGTAAGLAAAAAPRAALDRRPAMMTPGSSKPVVISSANGNRFKNGGDKTCVETAFAKIVKGDDVLDALIAGVNIVELDPEETASATAACRTPRASCSSIRAACTGRRSAPAASARSKACGRRRSWRRR